MTETLAPEYTFTAGDLTRLIDQVAADTYPRYRSVATLSADDISSEMWVWVLGEGKRRAEKVHTATDEGRLRRSLASVAKIYAETEKATAEGYDYSDVAWYSPEKLADLVPIALDSGWDGLVGESDDPVAVGSGSPGEGGNLLAMIVDIRRHLPAGSPVTDYDIGTDEGAARLGRLSDRLGGSRPVEQSYRKRPGNAEAAAITRRLT